jgi:hypothetical protein
MANELVEALERVFQNVDDGRRAQLIAWAAEELGTRPVITLLENDNGAVWEVGKPSPSNDEAIVFAMLMDDDRRAVHVYCAGFAVDGSGNEGTLYYKETVWRPRHTWGPLSIDALWNEWSAFFGPDDQGDDDEAPVQKPNGAPAQAGR